MNDLKPCPFCGGKMDGYPDYTISFKSDRRKVHGIYYKICTLHCNRCSCTIQQAGATNEEAEKHVYNVWNKRVPEEQQMLFLSPDLSPEQVKDIFDKFAMSKQNKQSDFADCFISKQAAMQLANELQISVDGYHMYNQAVNNYCAEIGGMKEAIVRCKDCKHNPKDTWFECPMSHLSEKQRPETAWCWKGERRTE